MCEYCEENYRKRGEIITEEGHEIYIDEDNDISINLDFEAGMDYLYFEIKYCPWCGRSLEDEEK
ncbi:hypothetical protein G6H11_002841 [Listeria monocytogenes]|nr:hypothetical protein [Listeria monocytogenes]EAE6524139.1 hypothetical protein [Listeria monocytogenes]EAF4203593.1 hypothetical protein [Listeria monocytogenes]EEO1809117.1 hypothetical protein [Listeria monocytogenes]EEO1837485.1 hypothetical protein [Listeria monocytogenes]